MKPLDDSTSRTAKIPFRIRNGKMVFYYGEKPLPKFKEGATGDIIIASHHVESKPNSIFQINQELELFPAGTKLLCCLQPHTKTKLEPMAARFVRSVRQEDIHGGPYSCLIEVVLKEPLKMKLRGAKAAALENCKVNLPEIISVEALSLNHAYTLLSEVYEAHRRSHTGNVFERYFYRNEAGRYQQLSDLRDHLMTEQANGWLKYSPK